jgi:uncharacterized RDD family membrane protein YckC
VLDDELVIETPERVELRFALASIGNRFLAAAIDHLLQALAIVGLLLLALWLSAARQLIGRMGVWAAALGVLLLFVIYWGYFIFFETLWSGQTPGKRWMRLRVIRDDGRPVRFFEVFVRNLLRFLDFQPFPSYAVGVLSIIFSEHSKRVGDFVAGTVVVKERSTEAPTLEDIVKTFEIEQRRLRELPVPFFEADTRILDDRELRAVETFLKRRFELPEPRRSMLAARIAQSVAGRLGISTPHLSPEALLEEVERLHRVQSRYVD